jgi:ribonuclease P protein component
MSLDTTAPVQVLMSVPKYNFKKAVDRNLLRRKMKEVYRKNKSILYDYLTPKEQQMALCISYSDKEIVPFSLIQEKIILLLQRLILENEKVTG